MTYTRTSPILNAKPTPIDTVALHRWAVGNGAKRNNDLFTYIEATVSGSRRMGIDPVVMLAQSALETDWWRSPWWESRLNPAGIGITGDDNQNRASQSWANGSLAARGHLAHMVAYVSYDWMDMWPSDWFAPDTYDQRFYKPIDAGYMADTLDDLNGTWAIDPENNYGGKIAARANEIIARFALTGETDMAEISFGNVPKPAVVKSPLTEPHPMMNAQTGPRIEGVVWHRMIGTLLGTDSWFHAGKAATAYGVGVAAIEPKLAGVIYEWIDPFKKQSDGRYWYGESSGPVSSPYGDGAKYVDRFGVAKVNPWTVAIEISGNYDTPLDEKARQSIVNLTAYYADQRQIPWTEFPNVPGQDRSFVHWHQEFTIGTGKICPGSVVMGETSTLIARVKETLKGYQTMAAPGPEYATPQPIPTGTQVINERLFLQPRAQYTLTKDVTPRLWADPTSPATGPELKKGATVTVSHIVKDIGEASELTLVLTDGSRIPAEAVV